MSSKTPRRTLVIKFAGSLPSKGSNQRPKLNRLKTPLSLNDEKISYNNAICKSSCPVKKRKLEVKILEEKFVHGENDVPYIRKFYGNHYHDA